MPKRNRNEVELTIVTLNSGRASGYLEVKTGERKRGWAPSFPLAVPSGKGKRVSALYIETQSNKQANDATSAE